ncbi:MAG: OmpA family protein [Candidatus Omnitrophica bacterium]|nr:OmpA family protein [Candidatus Omnitrophota bacterium]
MGKCLKQLWIAVLMASMVFTGGSGFAVENKLITSEDREENRKDEMKELQEKFNWWPTDAKPGPVKDEVRGGYWWWPTTPGKARPWGNRGYVYVYKIIFDYKSDELPPPKPQELRACLLVRKILKNVKIYFDFDKADLRDDAAEILTNAVKTLEKNPKASVLITGNCDVRGSENYNLDLGKRRAAVVDNFMRSKGVQPDRIRIISRGKLDAIAPVTDIVGMQKDRNAQFMVAEVEEVMMPYAGTGEPAEVKTEGATPVEEGKYVVEKKEDVTSEVRVSTKEYTVQQNDSLWKIAERECGSGHRWKYIYELNKDKIKNPNKLKPGTKIVIPIE